MKMKTLSVLAGISAPLIATAAADAGFVGVKVVAKPNEFGLFVCNVYAEFDNAGNDAMQAVAGTPDAPLSITVVGGTFWNHAVGTDLAPASFAVNFYPSLAFDSFYTIGVKEVGANGQPVNSTTLVGNIPQPLAGTSIATTNGSWAILGPLPQGDPFDPINSYPGNGQVLIGQFSTADGTGIVGTFLIQYVSDGVVTASVESFAHFIPTPGALGLLGAAGLIGFRRRRRA
jgi:hypothetical protein